MAFLVPHLASSVLPQGELCKGYFSWDFAKMIIIIIISTYTIYTFSNKSLPTPGTHISERTWDPSQKGIAK